MRSVLAIVAVAVTVLFAGVAVLSWSGAPSAAPLGGHDPSAPPPPAGESGLLAGITVGAYPDQVAFDPVNGFLYVTNHNYGSPESTSCPYTSSLSTVSVVAGSNGTLMASPVVGVGAVGIAYDPALEEMFVANCGSDNVSVISTVTNTVVGSLGVGGQPIGVTYDSTLGDIWVANSGSNNVSVISGSKVVATYAVGAEPQFLAYDAPNELMDVTNFGSSNVSAIGVVSHTVTSIPVGTEPLGIAYDPALKFVYVANFASDNLTVIDKSAVYANPAVGNGPWAVIYDAGTNAIYVTDYDGGNVSVVPNDLAVSSVDPYSPQPPVYLQLVGGTYDPLTGDLMFVNEGTNPGQLLDLPGATGLPGPSLKLGVLTAAPVAGTSDAAGHLYVPNEAGSNVTVSSNLGSPTVSVSVRVGADPHAAVYDPVTNDVFVTNTGSNNVSVLSATTLAVIGSVPVGASPEALAYDLVNHQIDVANFGAGTVSVISEKSLVVVATVPVGIGPTGVAVSDGFVYVVNSGSDTLTAIDGSNNTAFATYPTGVNPQAIVIDHGVGYIANLGSDNLTEFSASDPAVRSYTQLPAGGTFGGLVAADGFVYVAEPTLHAVAIVSEEFGQPSYGYFATVGWVATSRSPESLAYDAATGYVYVAFGSASVSLTTIITRADAVTGTLLQPAGTASTSAIAFDSSNGDLYVVDGLGSHNAVAVYGPDATTAKYVGVGTDPEAIAFDAADQDAYVVNAGSNNVSVIGSNNKVVKTLAVLKDPIAITYDSASGDLFVANEHSNEVSVISGLLVKHPLAVGTDPSGIAYDWVTGKVYVADDGSGNLTVLSGGSTPSQVGSIPVGADPLSLAVDDQTGTVYVSHGSSGSDSNLTEISPAQVVSSIELPFELVSALVWDNGTSQLFVGVGVFTSSVWEIDVLQAGNLVRNLQWQTAGGNQLIGGAWDPANGDLYLTTAGQLEVAVVTTGL